MRECFEQNSVTLARTQVISAKDFIEASCRKLIGKMNQCESDSVSDMNQIGVDNIVNNNNMNNANMNNTVANCAVSIADPVEMAVKESGALEQTDQAEEVFQPTQLQQQEDDKPKVESAAGSILQVPQAPSCPTTTNNIMISKNEPPPLHPPPLQSIQRHVPSNQSNIVMGSPTSCITGEF